MQRENRGFPCLKQEKSHERIGVSEYNSKAIYAKFRPVLLTTRANDSYRRSLKKWMGYVAAENYASLFDVSAVTALGWLLEDDGHMDDFLQRYRRSERDRRRNEVRKAVLLWLIDISEPNS